MVPLEGGRPDAAGRLEQAEETVDAARSAGIDVCQAERLLRQAQLALQVGNDRAAARLAEGARRSVRNARHRAAYLEMAFRRLEADIKDLRERGLDTSVMESRLSQARAMSLRDPGLSRERFAAAAEAVVSARRELADKKKRALLGGLGRKK